MNKFIAILVLFLTAPITSYADDSGEKLTNYNNTITEAIKYGDYDFACTLSKEAVELAKSVNGGQSVVYYNSLKNKSCSQLALVKKKEFDAAMNVFSAIEISRTCLKLHETVQMCANAGNFDTCMRVKYGSNYQFVPRKFGCEKEF